MLVGTVGALPSIAEGGEYPELKIGDSPETASFTKYGGYIPLTLELIDRDDTRKLKSYARELASAGMRKISKLVADIFSSNGGTGPEMGDGEALFNVTPVTTYGGHANLSATARRNAHVCIRPDINPQWRVWLHTAHEGVGVHTEAIGKRQCVHQCRSSPSARWTH